MFIQKSMLQLSIAATLWCMSCSIMFGQSLNQQPVVAAGQMSVRTSELPWMKDSMAKIEAELVKKYGDAQLDRIHRGLQQVADLWRSEDGNAAAF